MKKYILVLLVATLAACGSTETNEAKKAEIAELRKEANEIQSKIQTLEEEVEANGDQNSVKKFATPVTVKSIQTEKFDHYFEVSGSVEAVDAAYISPELNGQIKAIYVNEGQKVKKGEKLAKINTSIIESSIREVETGLELAKLIYNKQKQLWDQHIGSEIEYLQAKNNLESLQNRLKTLETQFEMAVIKSPIDGVVDDIFQKVGELALPGMQLMQVINLNNLIINADVSESHLANVKKGDKVELSFPSYPDIVMNVPIKRIGINIKKLNRTFSIELQVDNVDNRLKPNNMARIKINDFDKEDAIVVPSIIVKQDLIGSYLYVVKTDGKEKIAVKKYVNPGISYLDNTLIESGLNVSDQIIVAGYNLISDGSVISIK